MCATRWGVVSFVAAGVLAWAVHSDRIPAPRHARPGVGAPNESVVGPLSPEEEARTRDMNDRLREYMDIHIKREHRCRACRRKTRHSRSKGNQRLFENGAETGRMRNLAIYHGGGAAGHKAARHRLWRADGKQLKASIMDENQSNRSSSRSPSTASTRNRAADQNAQGCRRAR